LTFTNVKTNPTKAMPIRKCERPRGAGAEALRRGSDTMVADFLLVYDDAVLRWSKMSYLEG
jgi:hypothetical protein